MTQKSFCVDEGEKVKERILNVGKVKDKNMYPCNDNNTTSLAKL